MNWHFTLKFHRFHWISLLILNILSFSQYVTTCITHDNFVQSSFTALNILYILQVEFHFGMRKIWKLDWVVDWTFCEYTKNSELHTLNIELWCRFHLNNAVNLWRIVLFVYWHRGSKISTISQSADQSESLIVDYFWSFLFPS